MEVSYCRMIKHSAHGLWGAWEGSWSEVLPQEADLVVGYSSPIKEETLHLLFPSSLGLLWCSGGAVPAGLCIILMLPSLQSGAAASASLQ